MLSHKDNGSERPHKLIQLIYCINLYNSKVLSDLRQKYVRTPLKNTITNEDGEGKHKYQLRYMSPLGQFDNISRSLNAVLAYCIGKGGKKRDPLCMVGRKVNWCSHREKQCGEVCPQQNRTQNCCIIQQSHFGYASEGTKSLNPRGICTPTSTGSFFTTVET